MDNQNENIVQSEQIQYHEPRHPILYIILYCIGSVLCVLIGLYFCVLSYAIPAFLILGIVVTIIGPIVIIFSFFKIFKKSQYKKYFSIHIIAIPIILLILFAIAWFR
ncbi:MAG: hypothetical protein Q8P20_02915 [bacterium]|nr:hypothetical protein [bacterium]